MLFSKHHQNIFMTQWLFGFIETWQCTTHNSRVFIIINFVKVHSDKHKFNALWLNTPSRYLYLFNSHWAQTWLWLPNIVGCTACCNDCSNRDRQTPALGNHHPDLTQFTSQWPASNLNPCWQVVVSQSRTVSAQCLLNFRVRMGTDVYKMAGQPLIEEVK